MRGAFVMHFYWAQNQTMYSIYVRVSSKIKRWENDYCIINSKFKYYNSQLIWYKG